jgi:hypothetical protein
LFDQNSRLRTTTDADHDRHRRGQSQCTRASNDQHGDRIHNRVCKAWLRAKYRPDNKSEHRRGDNRGHKPAGNFVRESLDWRAASLRLSDHFNNSRKHCVGTDLLRGHQEASGLVDCSARHAIANRFLDGYRLAGDHRFVDAGFAVSDFAIDRNFLAGSHAQYLAGMHLIQCDIALLVVTHDASGCRR